MTAVHCAACEARLTADLRPGPLRAPVDSDATISEGTFSIDPEPRTVQVWERGMPDGTYEELETDPPGSFVVHPDDRLAMTLTDVPDRSNGCCGLDGCDGPNQACANCGAVVATARTDCWTEKEVRFLRDATVLR
jgi:hypothetical protein